MLLSFNTNKICPNNVILSQATLFRIDKVACFPFLRVQRVYLFVSIARNY